MTKIRRCARAMLIFKLVLQGVYVHRQRIVSPWRLQLRLIDGFEITSEIAAAAVHLCRFEPVQVIVDLGHPRGELLSSELQTRQALG